MNYQLSIIIPVYNEKNTLSEIIRQLLSVKRLNDDSVQYIIVDDGSVDGTTELLKNSDYEDDKRFQIIYHRTNQGKGTAIRTGLTKATGEYTIIQDGDLEYDPNDIVKLWEKAEKEGLKVIYGSRNLDQNNKRGTPMFYFGGRVVTYIANILYNQKLTDEPTCYKLFKTEFLKTLPLKCRRFEFCPEVTALTAKKNLKIQEISINYSPRSKLEGKKINWIDGLESIWTLIRLRLDLCNRYCAIMLIILILIIIYSIS